LHIPDGFLDPVWVVATYAVTVVYAVLAFKRALRVWSPEVAVAVSVLAAAIFVAQMLNWPLPGGTSLHFVGGGLAGVLLGPWLGFVVMFLVVVVQALVFHDGGITTLGANVLNMAVIDVVVAYTVYRLVFGLLGGGRRGRLVASFMAGWLGVVAAGVACGIEIGASPYFPYGLAITVPIMAGWHAALGVVEGLATAMVIDYLAVRAPSYVAWIREVVSGLER
jgi:cobalt/nickel transport system permease protein